MPRLPRGALPGGGISFLFLTSPLSSSKLPVREEAFAVLTWLPANPADIAVIAVLLAVAALAVRTMIRNKKAGKSSCGCDCASCGACGSCAAKKKE